MTTAEEFIANAKALLLDFDGPITALMPPPLNAQAADQARAALTGIDLPHEIATTTDHLAVLRFAARHCPQHLDVVERTCTEMEVACARESRPSPEIRRLLQHAERRRIPVAVVSNNSAEAIHAFLVRFEWATQVRALACRTIGNLKLMKPHPYLVMEAAQLLQVAPVDCVLVGDSVSDVRAAEAAGVPAVGLAKDPQRASELKAAGAVALLRHTTQD